MELLYALEAIRMPVLDQVMSAVTHLGQEYAFLLVCLIVLWCISKRQGFYLMTVGLLGTAVSQCLKLVFRIPRPWVIDPDFTIVESARGAATGYSFPSGHTQFAVGTATCLGLANNSRALRAVCLLVALLVPFSRMYLGVHTLLDVGVAFICAVCLAVALWPCFSSEERFDATIGYVLAGLTVVIVAYTVWVNVVPWPDDVDAENLAEGVKNGWLLTGAAVGMVLSRIVDKKVLRYDVAAPLPGQILKAVLGIVITVAIVAGLKPVLAAVTGGAAWASAIRYFLAVVFAGCIWPATFKFFAKVGGR